MPITTLVRNFAIESGELMDGTPPVAGTFDFTADGFIEFAEFGQGLFQELRMIESSHHMLSVKKASFIPKSAPTLSPVAGRTSLVVSSVTT